MQTNTAVFPSFTQKKTEKLSFQFPLTAIGTVSKLWEIWNLVMREHARDDEHLIDQYVSF